MKKILVITCTKSLGDKCQLTKSLKHMQSDVELVIVSNNTDGLSEVYNRYINHDTLKDHDIILFAHDDVYIDDLKLKPKLYEAIDVLNYDIVGLAGARNINIKEPALWHLMSTRDNWTGSVSHPVDNTGRVCVTCFGPWPERCLVLDGLFIAVNLKSALKSGWKFNENYEFHHYDIASCIDANNMQLKIGTYPIHVTHMSPGLSSLDDVTFKQSQTKFLNEYQ